MANATASPQAASADSRWWMPLVMGIIAICFGLLLLAHPAETSIWVAWLVGIYWFIGGVMNLISLFIDRTMWGWKLVAGVLGIFAGLLVLDAMGNKPLLATIGLATVYVWVLGITGIIHGIAQLVMAFQGGGWGVGLLGLLNIVLGGFLMANAAQASLVLPWVFAIFAIGGGIAAIFMAFKLKSA